MSVGLPWLSATRAEVMAGADGKRFRTAKRGAFPHAADPLSASAPTYARLVRYAEVLIDVRAHTETIVNCEQTHTKFVFFILRLPPYPVLRSGQLSSDKHQSRDSLPVS